MMNKHRSRVLERLPSRRELFRTIGIVGISAALPSCETAMVDRPLAIVGPQTLIPVSVEGIRTLAYELHIANFAAHGISIDRLSVIATPARRTLAAFSRPALAGRIASLNGSAMEKSVLQPGARAVIYIELVLPPGEPTTALHHLIEGAIEGTETAFAFATANSAVGGAAPVLGPPLRGGPWVSVYHPDWQRGHRRVVRVHDGETTIPGRFAIDWIRVDNEGAIARGDADIVPNHLGYAAEVLAVADARVVTARDGMQESASVSGNGKHTLSDASGNFIVLELGPAHYAFYEHLRPGSVRVAAGARVRRGEVIAALGFSGDSTGPHLHFHVANGPTIYSDGVPFVIDQFIVLGHYSDIAMLGSQRWVERDPGPESVRKNERPSPNAVVRLSD